MTTATWTSEPLWVLHHPEKGIVYALATSSSAAYARAVEVLHLSYGAFDATAPSHLAFKAKLRAEGWKARRCTLTVEL